MTCFAGSFTLSLPEWLIDRLADRTTAVGRCGRVTPQLVGIGGAVKGNGSAPMDCSIPVIV